MKKTEVDRGRKPGVTTDERERLKALGTGTGFAYEWVDRFNNRRLLEPIGNIRPPRPVRD